MYGAGIGWIVSYRKLEACWVDLNTGYWQNQEEEECIVMIGINHYKLRDKLHLFLDKLITWRC